MDTHPRKLTIFGCLLPSKDLPSSISCASDFFSTSEEFPARVQNTIKPPKPSITYLEWPTCQKKEMINKVMIVKQSLLIINRKFMENSVEKMHVEIGVLRTRKGTWHSVIIEVKKGMAWSLISLECNREVSIRNQSKTIPYQLCCALLLPEHKSVASIYLRVFYFPFLILPFALPGSLADATLALYTDEHLSITNYRQFW